MDYSKSTQSKTAFINNVFKNFTDAVGGDPTEFATILYGKYTVEDFAYSDDFYYFSMVEWFNKIVIPHKIAVYEAGIELSKQGWFKDLFAEQDKEDFLRNIWLHDMSKFSAAEAFGYAMYNRTTGHGKEAFEQSWHHHKMNNPHHPEYWLNPNRSGELEMLPMPNIYVVEMIADWMGAGKTYGDTMENWLPKNISKFRFANRSKVAEILRYATGINIKIHHNCLIVE